MNFECQRCGETNLKLGQLKLIECESTDCNDRAYHLYHAFDDGEVIAIDESME